MSADYTIFIGDKICTKYISYHWIAVGTTRNADSDIRNIVTAQVYAKIDVGNVYNLKDQRDIIYFLL